MQTTLIIYFQGVADTRLRVPDLLGGYRSLRSRHLTVEFATCDTKPNAHRTVNVAFFATHTNLRINGTLSQGEHAIPLLVLPGGNLCS